MNAEHLEIIYSRLTYTVEFFHSLGRAGEPIVRLAEAALASLPVKTSGDVERLSGEGIDAIESGLVVSAALAASAPDTEAGLRMRLDALRKAVQAWRESAP